MTNDAGLTRVPMCILFIATQIPYRTQQTLGVCKGRFRLGQGRGECFETTENQLSVKAMKPFTFKAATAWLDLQ